MRPKGCKMLRMDGSIARRTVEQVRVSELHVQDSLRLTRAVIVRNVTGGVARAALSEARISRSLTLLLESNHRFAPPIC